MPLQREGALSERAVRTQHRLSSVHLAINPSPSLQRRMLQLLWLSYLVSTCSASLASDLAARNVEAVVPGDKAYASLAAPYNQRFDWVRPAVICLPRDSEEVSACVKAASKHGVRVVARSGGHSPIANGIGGGQKDGALVIDSRHLNQLIIRESGIAEIGSGKSVVISPLKSASTCTVD
jgi:hypothetical protein